MEIKRKNTTLCDVYLKDNSYTIEEIMGEHTLTLNFLCRNVVDLEIGDYVDFDGSTYKIRHKEKITKRETSLGYEYSVIFYSSKYDLEDVVFFLNGKPEFKKNLDYYTGTARDWLNLIVKNMNREDTGWAAGSCIESEWITLSFKDKQVGSVLDELVKQLNTEYWISGKTISIGKRKYSSNGLTLGQGEGMGFTELEVSAVDDERPTTVIFPYGSDKNLGPDYGSDYLLLPGGVTELSKNTEKYGRLGQKKIQFDKIFPKGEFIVTARIDETTLQASGIDFNLTDCLLKDVEAIVTFQNGGLAGYDLAIVEGSWDNTLKQFKLKKNTQENALEVPGDIHFAVGDQFILTGIKMPQVYIDKASEELLKEASIWLEEHSEKRVQLRGKCDEVLFRQQNLFISPGQMVRVYSDQLKIDREIRVTQVKRFIENDNKPSYRYELTISDFLQGNGFKNLVDNIDDIPDEIEGKIRPVREWTKRTWRDVMETLKMMFDPDGDYFSEIIKPLAVHTAQLIVGTNSQQMDLIGMKFIPNADDDPNYFKNTAGRLVHFTVKEEGVAEWIIPSSEHRLNNSVAYYVYAKCSKSANSGSILVSERQIKLEAESGYYHFWIGVLNTPEEGVRSWNPNYGFTEIAGQTITTGVIKDKMARLIIDLAKAKITATNGATIEGAISFGEGSSGLENLAEWPEIKKIINNTTREISETILALNNFEDTVNGTFKDGIIEEAEARAIEKYINTLNTEKAEADAAYNKLYTNIYLLGTSKTDLLNSKITYNGAHTNLINSVNSAISDWKTTVAEKNDVDSKFAAYKNALADYKSKVEAANKAIQDTLKSYSDEALNKGKDAFMAASNAQISANQANQLVSGLSNYVDGAFSDGIIEEAESKAIEKYINTIKTSKSSVEATYNKLYVNEYLTGTAKAGLLNAKVSFLGAVDNLILSINSAIADGMTTTTEKREVDNKFLLFNSAMASFNTAVETANKAIQDKLKEYSDNVAVNVSKEMKNSMSQSLGYSNYEALEEAANAGRTVIKNGKINTVLIEATAIVTSKLIADVIMANALNVNNNFLVNQEGKATMKAGFVGPWTIEEKRLKYVGSDFSTIAKLYIGNIDKGNPDTLGARITALGIDAPFTISNSSAVTSHVKNAFIDNVTTSDKKTSMIIKTTGGGKNTALAIYGNLSVTGTVGERYLHLNGKMPNNICGFDHNHTHLTGSNGASFTLPSTTDINEWFGDDPNNWGSYHGGEGGVNVYGYDLHIVVARYQSGTITVYGNPSGGDGVSGHSGTQLYGDGVLRSSSGTGRFGYITLKAGNAGIFRLNRGNWYYFGTHA